MAECTAIMTEQMKFLVRICRFHVLEDANIGALALRKMGENQITAFKKRLTLVFEQFLSIR